MEVTKYIREYYNGEKQSALSLLFLAVVFISMAYLLFRNVKGNIVYGLGGGLLAFSLLQIISCLVICLRSFLKERKLISRLNDFDYLASEHDRIKKKVSRFPKIRMVQEIFFGLSFVSMFLGMAEVIDIISMGIAISVLLQMAIWIANDLFAQRRTEEYERRLRRKLEKKDV